MRSCGARSRDRAPIDAPRDVVERSQLRGAEVLREVVDADHLARRSSRAASTACASAARDDARRLRARDQRVDARARRQLGVEAAVLDRGPDLRLDRLGRERRGQRALDQRHRVVVGRRRRTMPAVRRSRVGRRLDQQLARPRGRACPTARRTAGRAGTRSAAAAHAMKRLGKFDDHALERVLRLEHRVPDRPVHQRRVGLSGGLRPRSA